MSGIAGLLKDPRIVRGAQIVIGFLVGWAALAKIGDLGAFARQVHNFQLLPVGVENLVAMTLPWIELMAALSLFLGLRPRSGAVVMTVLLVVFTGGVAAAMARGLNFECGCFGTASGARVGFQKILENLLMLAAAAIGCIRPAAAARSVGTVTAPFGGTAVPDRPVE